MTVIDNAPVNSAAAQPLPVPKKDGYLFGTRETLWTFALFCLLMIIDFADRLVIAALLPAIRAEWQITDAQAGLLGSVLALGMVLFAFPAAIATDRWSRVKTASLMAIFWSVASGLGAFAQNITQLAASRAAVGAGEAGYAPAAYAWITAAFPLHRRQLALGVFSACQPIGMAFGVALGGYIASHFGWRAALGLLALPGFVIAWYLYRARDYKTFVRPALATDSSNSAVKGERFSNLKEIFRTPSLRLAYASGAFGAFQWASIAYFLPSYFSRVHNVGLETASLMTSGILLISIPAIPLGGFIMDRMTLRNPKGKLTYGPTAAAVGILAYVAAIGFIENPSAQYVTLLFATFVMASAATTPLSMNLELVPPHRRALSGTCGVVIGHLFGSTPGPYVTGLLSDSYGLSSAFLSVILVMGGLSITALLLARRHYLNDLWKVQNYALTAG